MFRSALTLAAVLAVAPAFAQTAAEGPRQVPAILAGHAILPAETFIDPPADAPADARVSGKFTTPQRVEAIGTIVGSSNGRPTGVSVPFRGQPVQGHSGIRRMADGSFWILTDNGFGSRLNSPDALLFMTRYRINFETGIFERLQTVWFRDPNRRVPFRIAYEGNESRYLTGADFDLEGFQIIGDKIWLGDEFGPYLIRTDMNGIVEAVFETRLGDRVIRSPDHPQVQTPNPGQPVPATVNLGRSRGYEGLAASPDGRFLYGLLEGPVVDPATNQLEMRDGRQVLRIIEFSVPEERWTGRSWQYVLDQGATAIGDFNMIDATRALVIERDNGEGTADRACPEGQRREDCFHDLARFKRVVLIDFSEANANGPVRKIAYVDLMRIQDPNNRSRVPLNGGMFTFPFFTIENVDRVDAEHIVVGNDNNLPFSSSRDPNRADGNEMILLRVPELLNAR
jgi:hypothetical protein